MSVVLCTLALVSSSNALQAPEIRAKALQTGERSFLIQSTGEQNEIKTLHYHVHLPKTGGTTTSNMLVSDLCGGGTGTVKALDWKDRCTQSCYGALVDTEISCLNTTRGRGEHVKWNDMLNRVQQLIQQYRIPRVVFITTLRSGYERLISSWLHEMSLEVWQPPPRVPKISNESFLLYMLGTNWTDGWMKGDQGSLSQRNNFQVATLAPVTGNGEVEPQHLEEAKQTLRSEDWVIGFTPCLPQLHHKLWTMGNANLRHSGVSASMFNDTLPRVQQRTPQGLQFNETVRRELVKQTRFDNELYAWALDRSNKDGSYVACQAAFDKII